MKKETLNPNAPTETMRVAPLVVVGIVIVAALLMLVVVRRRRRQNE